MTEDMHKFYIFGDSICFGQHVSPHMTWVTRLSQLVQTELSPREIIINNASINGNTTRQALERMPYDVQSHRPEFLLIQFGMNDCNYWQTDGGLPRVSARAFEANLCEMIERAIACGTRHIFMNTNHTTPRTHNFPWASCSYQESNERYNDIIRTVCRSQSSGSPVTLIDIEAAWRERLSMGVPLNRLVLRDELHLAPEGHDIYFDVAAPIIAKQVLASL